MLHCFDAAPLQSGIEQILTIVIYNQRQYNYNKMYPSLKVISTVKNSNIMKSKFNYRKIKDQSQRQ